MNKSILEKKVYYGILYLFYSLLLTKKQQKYFECYFFCDYSLEEAAAKAKVSRNAIFTSLTRTLSLLDQYEQKLQLYYKHQARNDIYRKYYNFDFIKILEEIDKIK